MKANAIETPHIIFTEIKFEIKKTKIKTQRIFHKQTFGIEQNSDVAQFAYLSALPMSNVIICQVSDER